MSLAVLVPVNRLDRAKGRLEPFLSPEERRGLAWSTLTTVVEAVRGAGCRPLILTADPAVATVMNDGVEVVLESSTVHGLSAQIAMAVGPMEEVLVLHADLPLATAHAIRQVIAAAPPTPSVTIVESADGGTNAMLLRPPGRFALAYGRQSCARHVEAARAAGMTVQMVESPELVLDLDTAADLAAFISVPGWDSTPAGIFLLGAGVPGRLAALTEEDRRR